MHKPCQPGCISKFYAFHSGNTVKLPVFIVLFFTQVCIAQVPVPRFEPFQPVIPGRSPGITQPFQPFNRSSILTADPYAEQNKHIRQQPEMNTQPSENYRQIQRSPDNPFPAEESTIRRRTGIDNYRSGKYWYNLNQLLVMSPDKFSITEAIYLAESAWYDNDLPFNDFENRIKVYAEVARQIMRREGLDEKNNIAVNYAVQKLYKQDNGLYNKRSGKTYRIPKLGYDFDDVMGDKDWSNMFVGKLLQSGKGQCHSLPLLYLCIIEQLGGKAYLSLSPGHSFVQYFDKNGNRFNFETTNGNLVSQEWLMQSTGVSAAALKKGTYLDSLSSRRLFAQCLGDVLQGYIKKLGMDDFPLQLTPLIMEIDSTNITALAINARIINDMLNQHAHRAGGPPADRLSNDPDLWDLYEDLLLAHRMMDEAGIQQVTPDMYEQWLKSMEEEKQKEQSRLEYEKLLKEIKKLKNMKPSLKNTSEK